MVFTFLVLFLVFVVVPAVGGSLFWLFVVAGVWKFLCFLAGADKDKL